MLSQGVVTITQVLLCSLKSSIHSFIFSSDALCVWLSIIVAACSIWSPKNSPKFLRYILHLFTSATVVKAFNTAFSAPIFCTARITSLSLPTPDGSIIILSGLYVESTSLSASPKSPTREQHMQPEFISVTSIPDSCINAPSIPI